MLEDFEVNCLPEAKKEKIANNKKSPKKQDQVSLFNGFHQKNKETTTEKKVKIG